MPFYRGPDLTPGVRVPYYDFDLSATTFTAGCGQRLGNGSFDHGLIVQGDWAQGATGDSVTVARGSQLGNVLGNFYERLDPYQGTIVILLTPEWDGDDSLEHYFYYGDAIRFYKSTSNTLVGIIDDGALRSMSVSTASWGAGEPQLIIFRWDAKRTLDGTNYASITVNGVTTFGITTCNGTTAPDATPDIGASTTSNQACATLGGMVIYRRPLFDGRMGCHPAMER